MDCADLSDVTPKAVVTHSLLQLLRLSGKDKLEVSPCEHEPGYVESEFGSDCGNWCSRLQCVNVNDNVNLAGFADLLETLHWPIGSVHARRHHIVLGELDRREQVWFGKAQCFVE